MSILNNSLLLGAPAAGGYQVSRSLRFNSSDSAYLSRVFSSTGNRTTWTWAAWIKRSSFSSLTFLFHSEVDGNNETVIHFNSSDQLEIYNYQAGSFNARKASTAVFRDPSAWYHVVVTWDTANATAADRVRLYVNGSRITAFATSIDPSQNTTSAGINVNRSHRIGSRDNTVNYLLNGYLAEVFFIDGQALTPSSFTETSATTGQLIPKAYSGSFGTNGFWLKFSDNSAATATTLGKDYSGNSNNWTPNNFAVNQTDVNYNSAISFENCSLGGGSISNGFDANNSTFFNTTNAVNSTIVFAPSTAITINSSLQFRGNLGANQGYSVRIGSTVLSSGTNDPSGGTDWTVPGAAGLTISTTTPLRLISNGAGEGVYWNRLLVDGVELVNRSASGNDSLVDTPTSYGTDAGAGNEVRGNYCTWNPIDRGSQITVTNGNLDITATNTGSPFHSIRGTVGVSSGKWYWEATISTQASAADPTIGVANSAFSINTYVGSDANSWALQSINGTKITNGSSSAYGSSIATGDVVMVALDMDNGRIWFGKNGAWFNSGSPTGGTNAAFTGLTGTLFPACFIFANGVYAFNWGARPFAYTAPSGFKALCDTNLPAPVVAKSSDYFQTVLYTGNGSNRSITTTLSPDLVWIKSRSVGYNHRISDSVRGVGKELFSNQTWAEETNSADGYVSAFNSDGFSLTGGAGVNANNQTFAAWCWDAGSSTVTNTQGSITSSCRTNQSSGFSVITFNTQASGTATVGHGLGVAPEMFIIKARTVANNWWVYHKSLPTPQSNAIALNLTNAALGSTTLWNNTAPTSSVLSLDSGWAGNNPVVVYAWAPVAGYSSFGSYVGTANADGPMVWLGFRPRWILFKNTSVGVEDWWLHDTARNTYNVMTSLLVPNSSNAEGTNAAHSVDALSNGFKIRTTAQGVNGSGHTIVYAAFAENPFQYARAR